MFQLIKTKNQRLEGSTFVTIIILLSLLQKRNHPAKKQHDGKQSHSDMHKGSEKDQEVLPFQSNDEDEKVSPNISDEDSLSVSER